MQLIEGRAEAVESLYDRIARDGRHHNLAILGRQAARASFPQWAMRCVHVPGADDGRSKAIEVLLPKDLAQPLRQAMLTF